jgi:Ulp1 protease family, C-terminal catalytic domain
LNCSLRKCAAMTRKTFHKNILCAKTFVWRSYGNKQIIIPINDNNVHWYLAIVNIKVPCWLAFLQCSKSLIICTQQESRTEVYDSYGNNHPEVHDILHDWIKVCLLIYFASITSWRFECFCFIFSIFSNVVLHSRQSTWTSLRSHLMLMCGVEWWYMHSYAPC